MTGRTQQEVWASLADYDLRPALARLALPTVVLHGTSDPIPIETARTLAELLKAEFHPLLNCGHVPYVEAPGEFVRVMDGFLPSESGARS